MNNLIFLGGPHGSGKTTLAEYLMSEIPEVYVPELSTRTPKFYSQRVVDFFHRQALKHAQRAIENYEYLELAGQHPDKIVLGNRCVYDVLAYDRAYCEKGWISEEEKNSLRKMSSCLYNSDLRNPNVIILNPGFEVCKRHLINRWKSNDKKFMEADMEYLIAVCNAYKDYQERDDILYIDSEMDFEDIGLIKEWVQKVRSDLEVVCVYV